MSRKRYFISPNSRRGGWDLQQQNGQRATRRFDTKEEALEYGRPFVRGQGNSQLVVQRRDGQIQTEHTYGSDPEKYPG